MERIELKVTSKIQAEQISREARRLSVALGFPTSDAERVALATMELATNLARYASNGRMSLEQVTRRQSIGIQIESHDDGPGIADIDSAMTDGFSTGGGLGHGLPGVRRLLHELEIDSGTRGTTIVGRHWLKTP
jgi:serine/threonine-protein kinase RsbT